MSRPAICRTRTGTPPAPGSSPRAGSGAAPSGRRSRRPPLPPHRVLHPKGHAALEDITFHRQLSVLAAQPGQLRPLIFTERAVTAAAAGIGVDPVAHGARVD